MADATGQTPRRAAVSSFGMSRNERPRDRGAGARTTVRDDAAGRFGRAGPLVFPLSATSVEELRRTARAAGRMGGRPRGRAWRHGIWRTPWRVGVRTGPVRTAVMAASLAELAEELRAIAEVETPYPPAVGQDDRGPVWVFSGQGSQWAAMGAELLAREPVFAAVGRQGGAADRPRSRVLGDRGDVGARDGDRHRPGPAGPVHDAGRAGHRDAVLWGAARRGHRAFAGRGRGGRRRGCTVAGRRRAGDLPPLAAVCRAWPVAGRWPRWSCPPTQVRDELDARGVTDVVVSVVASPQSTVIGGATQTVRDLVAAWEERGLMAREVAVDVASHSPQVDPILAELADVLADLTPMTPTVPFYSATLDDPRGSAGLRCRLLGRQPAPAGAVRRGGAGGAGGRAPRLRRALPASAADPRGGADRASRRPPGAGARPHAARAGAAARTARLPRGSAQRGRGGGFLGAVSDRAAGRRAVADLDSASAAHRVRRPRTTGARRHHRRRASAAGGARAAAGGAGAPRLAGRRRHRGVAVAALTTKSSAVPALPGAAYCEMALAAARTVLGEDSEVRDIRFEQLLLLNDETPVAAVATVEAPGVVEFEVETDQDGERTRRAVAVLHAIEDEQEPPRHDMRGRARRAPVTRWTGLSCGSRSTAAGSSSVPRSPAWPPPTPPRARPPPCSPKSRCPGRFALSRAVTACTPRCWMPASSPSRRTRPPRTSATAACCCRWAWRGCASAARRETLATAYVRVTTADRAGIEADLDVMDESGTVVLIVRGLRMGTRAGESSKRDRVLAERLLTVEWQQQALPELPDTDARRLAAGHISDADDPLTSRARRSAEIAWCAM